jgi:hypothetical protein
MASVQTFATKYWTDLGRGSIHHGLAQQRGGLLQQPISSSKRITVAAGAALQLVGYLCHHGLAIGHAIDYQVACFGV